ncbi:MAG: hypothetical protein CENE_00537 [Candidatus Celerinatantimonas neptuna]|nr:MAG: hypothetical protein CENE_00537 [Candidatus Celerinatantimonas neptuna]
MRCLGRAAAMFCGGMLLAGCQSPVNPALNYRIMTMRYGVNHRVPYDPRCKSFSLSPADAVRFFQNATEVGQKQFRQFAMTSSCYYDGSMMINGDILQWRITGAGVGFLSRGLSYADNQLFLCSMYCQQAFGQRFPVYKLDQ